PLSRMFCRYDDVISALKHLPSHDPLDYAAGAQASALPMPAHPSLAAAVRSGTLNYRQAMAFVAAAASLLRTVLDRDLVCMTRSSSSASPGIAASTGNETAEARHCRQAQHLAKAICGSRPLLMYLGGAGGCGKS